MKKKNILYRFPVIFSLLFFVSCELLFFDPNVSSSDSRTNFDYLWNEIDRKYSYFELKDIDWDQVKEKYAQHLYDDMSEDSLFAVLASMMNELRDDHSNLFSPFNLSRYNLPLRKPDQYNFRTIEEHYLPHGRITGPFFHDFLADGQLGYVRYSSFASAFDSQQLDHLLTRYQNTKGLIIDVRENGGGDPFNVVKILERFTSEKTLVGYFITRNGKGHSDFGERENFFLGTSDSIRYTQPLIILTDWGSYSATTMFAVAAKALPNVTLLGDTTGGGGGLPNGGQLPNGWTYRFSISQLLDLDGVNYAEEGVPPDIVARFDWSDLTRDEVLEKAIAVLLP